MASSRGSATPWPADRQPSHLGSNGNDCASIWAPEAYCDAGGARRGEREKLSNSAGRSTGHVTIDNFNDPFQYSRGAISILQGNFKGAGNFPFRMVATFTVAGWSKSCSQNIALNGISRKLPNPAVSDQESHGGDRFSFLKSGCNPSNRQSFTSRTCSVGRSAERFFNCFVTLAFDFAALAFKSCGSCQ
jgi:hypothetical protein